eukprot:g679.t1
MASVVPENAIVDGGPLQEAREEAEKRMIKNAKEMMDGPKGGPMGGVASNAMPEGQCFTNPKSPFMKKWDNFIMALLLYVASVTPFEVAFLGESKLDALFLVNCLVDLGFITDMFIQFTLGFLDEESNEMIYHHGAIAHRYLTTWFTIDFISIIPFNIFAMAIDTEDVDLTQLKMIRIIRLLRLIKLLRVLRSARILKRIEHSLGWSFVSFSLIKFAISLVVTMHWVACFWAIVPSLSGSALNWYTENGMEFSSTGDRYAAAIEFAMMAFVVGYGSFSPTTTSERVVALFCMFIAGSIYAYLIGSICTALSNRDPGTQRFHQTMDLLNMYMAEIRMPQEDRYRMREFVQNCKGLQRQEFYQDVLRVLSPQLQGEFAMRTTGAWIRKVPFFCCSNDEEREKFIISIALVLNRRAYTRGEMLFKTAEKAELMYIISQGVIGAKGSILRSGDFIGEDMIMQHGLRTYRATAMTFVDTQTLTRERLFEVLSKGDFPETTKLIHIAALRLAIRKYFKQLVTAIRTGKMLAGKHKKMTKEEIEEWKEKMKERSQQKRKRITALGGGSKEEEKDDIEEILNLGSDPVRTVLQANKPEKEPDLQLMIKKLEKMESHMKLLQSVVQNTGDSINELRGDFAKHLGIGSGGTYRKVPSLAADDDWRPRTPADNDIQNIDILDDLKAAQNRANRT